MHSLEKQDTEETAHVSRVGGVTLLFKKSIEQVAILLDQGVDENDLGQPMFTDKRYIARGFDPGNFHPFDMAKGEKDGRMSYVDGGNLEILRAPNLSVSLVRTYYNIFDRNGTRVRPKTVPERMEFFVVAYSRMHDGDLMYSALLVPLADSYEPYLPTGGHLQVDSMDRAIAPAGTRADISVMGSLTRRFSEWLLAYHVMDKELEAGDMLVRDGTLQTAMMNEMYYAGTTFAKAKDRGVLLTALAKTSTLFTTTGHPLIAAVDRLSEDNGLGERCWFYHPVVENNHPAHQAEIFVCRLHERSNFVFRFEVFRDQASNMPQAEIARVFERLARNSTDLTFLGYPYGLVDADMNARVHVNERDLLFALCRAELMRAGIWDKVSRCMSATSAHDVLDSI